jgi:hypothetical protein
MGCPKAIKALASGRTAKPRAAIAGPRYPATQIAPLASLAGRADLTCREGIPHLQKIARSQGKPRARANRPAEQSFHVPSRRMVAPAHAFTRAVRFRLIEERRADIIRAGDHQDLLALTDSIRYRAEIGDEGRAIALSRIGKQAKKVMGPQADGHFSPAAASASKAAASNMANTLFRPVLGTSSAACLTLCPRRLTTDFSTPRQRLFT